MMSSILIHDFVFVHLVFPVFQVHWIEVGRLRPSWVLFLELLHLPPIPRSSMPVASMQYAYLIWIIAVFCA